MKRFVMKTEERDNELYLGTAREIFRLAHVLLNNGFTPSPYSEMIDSYDKMYMIDLT